MELRNAREPDVAAVAKLMLEVQDAHVEAFPHRYRPVSVEAAEAFLVEQLAGEKQLLVATDGGVLLGYALVEILAAPDSPFLRPRRYGYLHQICVDSSARGHGVGKALMARIREICDSQGVEEIELDVWAFNATGRKFFERAGYEEFATKMRSALGAPAVNRPGRWAKISRTGFATARRSAARARET